MKSIYGFTLERLEDYLESNNIKRSRAKIIFRQVYEEKRGCVIACDGLNEKTAEAVNELFSFELPKIRDISADEDVCKLLLELEDGNLVETVVMEHNFGRSVCVSTQVGCNMGCAFCESGRLKRVRSLEICEIVQQVLCAERETGKITNAVLMGIGEPFDNYDNTMSFIDIIGSPFGLDIGSRHITVSTGGIVPKIREYSLRPVQNNLAVSLHAPDNEIRGRLMKINKTYPIEELVGAVREYSQRLNKRVTFEYIMLSGVNDSLECADKLAQLIEGIKCYVNLIPYNETDNIGFRKSSREQITLFYERLKAHGVWVTVRHEFGSSIKAACGQLRAEFSTREK